MNLGYESVPTRRRGLSKRQRILIAAIAAGALVTYLFIFQKLSGTPSWVSGREHLPDCGRAVLDGPAEQVDKVRNCLLEAQDLKVGAEAVLERHEGATTVRTIARVLPEARAELFEQRSIGAKGKPTWTQRVCIHLVAAPDGLTCG